MAPARRAAPAPASRALILCDAPSPAALSITLLSGMASPKINLPLKKVSACALSRMGIDVGTKLERLAAGHAHEVLAYLEDPLDDSHRENEVPAEANRADIDRGAELVGRVHAKVVIPEAHTRLADPAGVDHPGIPERGGEIIDVRIASSVASRKRPKIAVVALLPIPVSPEEHIVAGAKHVVDTRNELLAQFPEWEGAAVLLEQGHHGRSMSRHQRISELTDQRRKGRRRAAERINQRLL